MRTSLHFAWLAIALALLAGCDSKSKSESPGPALAGLRVTQTGGISGVAGIAAAFTLTAINTDGSTSTGYRGTVAFTSSDPSAVLPAAHTFTSGENGQTSLSVTFKTSGVQTLNASDAASGALNVTANWEVSAAAAADCVIDQLPAAAPAGAVVGLRVTLRDAFLNRASGFSGNVALASSDARAQVSPPVTFDPLVDAGMHVFSARLLTEGNQSIVATPSGLLACSAQVAVLPTSTVLALSAVASANAAAPVTITVTAQDAFGNVVSNYAGTVHFTSTDAAATVPADLVFTGAEGGVRSTTATFATLGSQALTGTQVSDSTVTGTTTLAVHGFVYTNPSSGFGKVRMVLNQGASSASLVQLDLIQVNALTIAYGVGMNLPLDTTRAAADATLLVEGTALSLGTAPKASAAKLSTSGPAAGMLLSAVSQKASGAGAKSTDSTVAGGARYYSLRLALPAAAAVGTVFDGNALPAGFRAAVRDRVGNDTVTQSDFALGKLEVR
jgi:hypothetical protein